MTEVNPNAGQQKELSPMIQMAMMFLLGLTPQKREEIVTQVCDTLGAYPRFWRSREKGDEEPINVACVVRVANQNAPLVPVYAIAAFDGDAQAWMWNANTIAGVTAWAVLPT